MSFLLKPLFVFSLCQVLREQSAVPRSEDGMRYAVFQNTDNKGHCLLTSESSSLDTAAISTTAKHIQVAALSRAARGAESRELPRSLFHPALLARSLNAVRCWRELQQA